MAKLLTYFDLCSISDHKEFLGLSEDSEPGTVINTLGRNIVLLVQLSNQQQVQSWNVLEKLTSKVVYDFRSKRYAAVFFNRFLRLWTAAATDVNKVKKLKIPNAIHELVSYQRRDTIVLYKDGTCESLELCLETRKSDRPAAASSKALLDPATTTILNVAHFQTASGDSSAPLLTYFVRNADATLDLVFYRLDEADLTPAGPLQRLRIARPDNGATLVGQVVVDGDAHPSLMTLWSDKRIFMMPLRPDASTASSASSETATNQSSVPGYFVAMLNAFKLGEPLCIRAVGRDCVAIYGANEQQEGGTLVLYNTRFNVAQSKQFFKVYFNNARIWVLGKYILLAYGQTLACVSFRIAKEQLADMVGTQRTADFAAAAARIDQDSINEEAQLEEAFAFDAERQKLANEARQADMEWSEEDVGGGGGAGGGRKKATPAAAELVDSVQRDLRRLYAHDVLVEVTRGDSALSDQVQLQPGSNVRDSVAQIDEVLLLGAELERSGASEFEITERLVPLLVKARRPDELRRCLRKYANISDRVLAKALKFFLNLRGDEEERAEQAEVAPVSTVRRQTLTVDAAKAPYVNCVLSCSFAADQLMAHLRTELDFCEVLCLLRHITSLLAAANSGLEEMVQFGDAFNEDLQLLAWFGVIVDAHYQQFVLSRNAELLELLSGWQEYVDGQIEAVRGMKALSAELYSLVQGKRVATDRQSSKWYSVEVIKLY